VKIKPGTPYWKIAKAADNRKWEDWFLFHLKVAGLPKPKEQFRFAEVIGRRWQTDFAWPDRKLIVEIEGGIWRKDEHGQWSGAHTHPTNVLRDIEKYNHMALLGYRLLRFSPRDLKDGSAIEMMKKVLAEGDKSSFDVKRLV
jgi:very-short-patch-repair endonuclease